MEFALLPPAIRKSPFETGLRSRAGIRLGSGAGGPKVPFGSESMISGKVECLDLGGG